MSIEFDLDIEIDQQEFRKGILENADQMVAEWLESEAQEGKFECECGSESFDIETWQTKNGDVEAAGVCRECNDRMEIDIDVS